MLASFHWRSRAIIAGSICLMILLFVLNAPIRSTSLRFARHGFTSIRQGDINNVFNQTLGFQKIFVISLTYRTDQQDSMALAAALTGLEVEFVDGVTEVNEKALPAGAAEVNLNNGSLNAWRAHMNVARKIIEQNITSALVLEGDIDWDIRIKAQMREFALASRLLLQPLTGTTDKFHDPSLMDPSAGEGYNDFPVDRTTQHTTVPPLDSPYGDLKRWDLLWLGHCGAAFPTGVDRKTPRGRAVISNDITVPEHQHLDMQFGNGDLIAQYPAHSRVVSWAQEMTCTLAYGMSQLGARRLLYELSIRKMTGTNDMMFRSLCQGTDEREQAVCLTVQPQLFQHFRPAGSRIGFSDINDFGREENKQAFTRNVRWSTRLNFPKLLKDETDYIDQYKDGKLEDLTPSNMLIDLDGFENSSRLTSASAANHLYHGNSDGQLTGLNVEYLRTKHVFRN